MKKETRYIVFILFAFLATFAGGGIVSAQTSQQDFNKANDLYKSHQYDSALVMYRQLIKKGFNNTELYYNAGNASYKNGKLGYAVYYFEKALQESPGNKVIKHNLSLAKQRATDRVDQVPTLFFVRWWHGLLHLHTPNGWVAGSIVLFWILVFFVGWRLLRRDSLNPPPRWTKWMIVLFAILCGIYLSGAIGSWYQKTHHIFAIIIKTDEPLKAAPDSGSSNVVIVHEGLKVKILDSVSDWRKIKLTDGKEGWVEANSLLDL